MGTTEKLLAELVVLRAEKADMQNQLSEKEAMIDWLAEQASIFSDHAPASEWRKAAQEAVKK